MSLFESIRRLLFGERDGVRRADRDVERRRDGRERAGERAPRAAASAGDRARVAALGLPPLDDVAALAAALELEAGRLRWLVDARRLAAERDPHYRLTVWIKRDGRYRVVLAPRPALKRTQRWILRNVLDRLTVEPSAHGFVRGRSIFTNAAPHVGRAVVLRVDVRDFFHRFSYRHVLGLFRSVGYSSEVASALAFLCTAPVREMHGAFLASGELDPRRLRAAIAHGPRGGLHPILPQGAPTSPALANLLCRRLDRRLAGLAHAFGASYTRYADDLTFSGDAAFRRDVRRFVPLLRQILREERLPPAPGKLAFARKGARQRVTGLVVNRRINVPRDDVRRLRAIVHNCVTRGPAGENRAGAPDFRAHLRGRIEHVRAAHAEHGARLLAEFERIEW